MSKLQFRGIFFNPLRALLVLGLLLVAMGAEAGAEPGAPLVDLNTATAEELESLPGVGAAKAAAIVEYRAAGGAFTSIEELEEVRGIGPAMVAKLRPLVTLGSRASGSRKPGTSAKKASAAGR